MKIEIPLPRKLDVWKSRHFILSMERRWYKLIKISWATIRTWEDENRIPGPRLVFRRRLSVSVLASGWNYWNYVCLCHCIADLPSLHIYNIKSETLNCQMLNTLLPSLVLKNEPIKSWITFILSDHILRILDISNFDILVSKGLWILSLAGMHSKCSCWQVRRTFFDDTQLFIWTFCERRLYLANLYVSRDQV